MEDVWKDAPKDAEFFSRRLQNYYKIVDGVLFWVKDGLRRGEMARSRHYVGHRVLGVLEPRPVEPDEWIEHHGSNNPPVHPDTVVAYKMRTWQPGTEPHQKIAGGLRWNHRDTPGDIIAYKVVKKP